jgi:hypothetical protein
MHVTVHLLQHHYSDLISVVDYSLPLPQAPRKWVSSSYSSTVTSDSTTFTSLHLVAVDDLKWNGFARDWCCIDEEEVSQSWYSISLSRPLFPSLLMENHRMRSFWRHRYCHHPQSMNSETDCCSSGLCLASTTLQLLHALCSILSYSCWCYWCHLSHCRCPWCHRQG